MISLPPKPPHHDSSVDGGAGDAGGWFPDLNSALNYAQNAVESPYGQDRVRAIRHVLREVASSGGLRVVDFGGGDGALLKALSLSVSHVDLIDISESMLAVAKQILSHVDVVTHLGSVERLAPLEPESVDLVLCVNTLNYLDDDDQDEFFREAHRVLRSDGHLVVMTGNELLDLFALNSGTADFFSKNFGLVPSGLLVLEHEKRWKNAGRFNPLSFAATLERFGLVEVSQAFSQWHQVPPGLASIEAEGELAKARLDARDHSFDPNSLAPDFRWQALFRCSMFASLSIKP